MNVISAARRLAQVAHWHQTDQTGEPYIAHPQRIASACAADQANEFMIATAWLHDVVEDTPVTFELLVDLGFDPLIVDAVDAITHREGEQNVDYWARVKANPIARFVKLRDIADNLQEWRLQALEPELQTRLRHKYARALAILT